MPALQKSHFCFDHVNRLSVSFDVSYLLRSNVQLITRVTGSLTSKI